MKKLLLGLCALLSVAFLFLRFDNAPERKTRQVTVNKTLNGIDEVTARQMIANFDSNYLKDVGPKSLSVWYSVDQIRAINNLLIAEHASKNTDGVRFYFGCDKPAAGTTKLKTKLLLVSTVSRPFTDSTISTHVDYYTHTASFLNVEAGLLSNGNATQVMKHGGFLYNANAPAEGTCGNPSGHFLTSGLAYKWVQARCENNSNRDDSVYNTKSEWFPYCFLTSLFSVIADASHHFSGLRIYEGKGLVSKKAKKKNPRDVFILMPTQSAGQMDRDYPDCLEQYLPNGFCGDTAKVQVMPQIQKAKKVQKTKTILGVQNIQEKMQKTQAFAPPPIIHGGGYDEGELCPDVCN
ncbi:hypothetical protein [Mucilaginibacter paludis]|uniref:Uncharacterized protein n=1 Tax=Mucilaginibacter paludis DSM 18603 TaxID=714943 RepID=H1Y056_9SPHI|nr:hypothetical protein [Mucilaginibacter paludis]EHQ27965.1 hypothetical protein Mucpa_3873 [Mucilaginibacter paludis DSM 18603]